MKDYYKILNVSESAQKEEINEAYQKEVSLWKNRLNTPQMDKRQEVSRRLRDLDEAKNILLNTTKRAEYDKQFIPQEVSQYGSSNSQKEKKRNFIQRLPEGLELEMVAIPAGSFLMGSANKGKFKANIDEKPQHKVEIAAFHMGKYPITQEQYQVIMEENPSYFPKGGKYPVEGVSWDNAQKFCRKLSKITGRTYRLPSEAQWEYAARAGTQTRYFFGDKEGKLGQYAWYFSGICVSTANIISEQIIGNILVLVRNVALIGAVVNFVGNILYFVFSMVFNLSTHPVGQKKPNAWGLYDMLGNVLEWCDDDWHSDYQGAPKDGRAWMDNEDLSQSNYRTMRGGSWHSSAEQCTCASRHCGSADDVVNVGLRVVL